MSCYSYLAAVSCTSCLQNLKKQAEKNQGYISFLEGQSPSSPHPPNTDSIARSNAGMMSARAFLVSRTASFTVSEYPASYW